MGPVRANLLLHRGYGLRHLDLVLGTGARCPTLRLERVHGRWRAIWSADHRRRYLAWAGPLDGDRGVVERRWNGLAQWRGRFHQSSANSLLDLRLSDPPRRGEGHVMFHRRLPVRLAGPTVVRLTAPPRLLRS